MNIRYPIYEGVYRILTDYLRNSLFFRIFKLDITIKNKTYGRYYNFIAGVFGSWQALEGRLRRIQ